MKLQIIDFIINNEDWKEKLSKEPYNLIIIENDTHYLLKYNQLESDFNEQICKEARGLIIRKDILTVEALSFTKFFNVQEPLADKIHWKSARVYEKVDGSKILVWFNNVSKIGK